MGKKRKPNRQREDVNDKPAFAADVFQPEKKPVKPKRSERDISLEEHLKSGTAERLAALREQITRAEEDAKATKPAGKSNARARGAERRDVQPDDNKSFAELFDPQEDDEESFETLLKDSKLDWRSYKD